MGRCHPKGVQGVETGEHGKQFDIRSWLERRGYKLVEPQGSTTYGGRYDNGKRSILVSLTLGEGAVEFSVFGSNRM